MSMRNVSGGIFLALMAFVLVGPLIGALPYQTFPGNAQLPVGPAVLGVAWILAVWGALVSIMVFLIAWMGERFQDASFSSEDQRAGLSAATAESTPIAIPTPLARAS